MSYPFPSSLLVNSTETTCGIKLTITQAYNIEWGKKHSMILLTWNLSLKGYVNFV